MSISAKPAWKEFEIAVGNFVEAFRDPNAVVTPNFYYNDKHTGSRRQCDVWVEAKVCNFFPIKVHISCKHKSRKVSEQEMDAFIGELASSGADKGVIYSLKGFTKQAVTKAKVNEISCCQLYQNSPPDLPVSLCFPGIYCFAPSFKLHTYAGPPFFKTWNDIFNLSIVYEGEIRQAIDVIIECEEKKEKEYAALRNETDPEPQDWTYTLEIKPVDFTINNFQITIIGFWRVYRGKLDAHLANGTYSMTENEFKGVYEWPVIDTFGPTPGDGWEATERNPSDKNSMRMIFFCGNRESTKKGMIDKIGIQLLNNVKG